MCLRKYKIESFISNYFQLLLFDRFVHFLARGILHSSPIEKINTFTMISNYTFFNYFFSYIFHLFHKTTTACNNYRVIIVFDSIASDKRLLLQTHVQHIEICTIYMIGIFVIYHSHAIANDLNQMFVQIRNL